MKKTILLTFSTFMLIAAGISIYRKYFHEEEIPAGGPCSYDYEYFPARIIGIDLLTADSTEMDLAFEVSYDGMPDTVTYSLTNDSWYNAKAGEVKPDTGLIMRYVHKYITEGSCSPDFFYIEMQPFKSHR